MKPLRTAALALAMAAAMLPLSFAGAAHATPAEEDAPGSRVTVYDPADDSTILWWTEGDPPVDQNSLPARASDIRRVSLDASGNGLTVGIKVDIVPGDSRDQFLRTSLDLEVFLAGKGEKRSISASVGMADGRLRVTWHRCPKPFTKTTASPRLDTVRFALAARCLTDFTRVVAVEVRTHSTSDVGEEPTWYKDDLQSYERPLDWSQVLVPLHSRD